MYTFLHGLQLLQNKLVVIHSLLVKIRKCPRVKKIYTIKSTLRNKTNTKRTMLNIKFKPKYTTKIKAVIFCLLKIYIFVVNIFFFQKFMCKDSKYYVSNRKSSNN